MYIDYVIKSPPQKKKKLLCFIFFFHCYTIQYSIFIELVCEGYIYKYMYLF